MQKFFCDYCGTRVKKNALRCPYCGRYFKSVKCPSCGLSGNPDLFVDGCPICGYAGENKAREDNKSADTAGKTIRKTRPGGYSDVFYKIIIPALAAVLAVLIILSIRIWL